jgi:hypothetical protein
MQVWKPTVARRRSLCLTALLFCLSGARSADLPTFVAVAKNGLEVGTADILLNDDQFWLPLESFTTWCDCEVEALTDGLLVSTPMGRTTLPDDAVRAEDGVRYLSSQTLEQELFVRARFNASEFVVALDFPWPTPPNRRQESIATRVPDVRAPGATLSTLRTQADYFTQAGVERYFVNTWAAGRAAGGSWRLSYIDDLQRQRALREYSWARRYGNTSAQVGFQRINAHPVLIPVQYTGAQVGISNGPTALPYFESYAGPLINRASNRSLEVFEGVGPVAGRAELWINDTLRASQVIGFDGAYRFRSEGLPGGAERIEIRIFERRDSVVPVDIRRTERQATDLLLAPGQLTAYAGVGEEGNPLDPFQPGEGLAGASMLRYGLTGGLTMELGLQRRRGTEEAMAGLVSRLPVGQVFSAALASNARGNSLFIDLSGQQAKWRWRAANRERSAGFTSAASGRFVDRYAELEYEFSPWFRLGAVARSLRTAGIDSSFVKPTFFIRPVRALTVFGGPQGSGDYRYEAVLAPGPHWRAEYRRLDDNDFGALRWRRNDLEVLTQVEAFSGRSPRYLAQVSRFRPGSRVGRISLGAQVIDSNVGPVLELAATPLPGLSVNMQFRPNQATGVSGFDEALFRLSVTADLGGPGGRFVRASSQRVSSHRGGIVGALMVDGRRLEVADVLVLANGSASARTQRDGRFFLGNLEPGVYAVQLDEEKVPIELSPVDRTVNVEVVAGGVSRMVFLFDAEYGAAGRVIGCDGNPLAGAVLRVVDARGRERTRAVSDRFGLFRVDGLRTGTYRFLLLADQHRGVSDDNPTLAQRAVTLSDNYLFGQDLVLSRGRGCQLSPSS